MRVFVRQKSAAANARGPIGEVIGARAVFARLMMLQAFAADHVTDRKKKIVVIVVMRVEQLLRFDHQILVELQLFRADLEIGRLVGEDIEEDGIVRTAGQSTRLKLAPA